MDRTHVVHPMESMSIQRVAGGHVWRALPATGELTDTVTATPAGPGRSFGVGQIEGNETSPGQQTREAGGHRIRDPAAAGQTRM
ncbi:MAG: hypothetical protein OEO23_12520, partial [Gemmatimonadota bacterium]|nr:hypothetical protein [Gemmatimonadota bacterium]